MTQEYTQDEINAILASIEVDDASIDEDTRRSKISSTLAGRRSPMAGKHHTDATKARLKETRMTTNPKAAEIMGGKTWEEILGLEKAAERRALAATRTKKVYTEEEKAASAEKARLTRLANKDKPRKQREKMTPEARAEFNKKRRETQISKGSLVGVNSKYIYNTPMGEMTKHEMKEAYKDIYNIDQLNSMTAGGRYGFSRRLKDV